MQAGEYGILIELETGQDLAGATALALRIAQPDGTVLTVTPTASGTLLQYTSQPDDFPEEGTYRLQGTVDFGEEQRLLTTERDLIVQPAI